jgi:hypothetical protein
VTGADQPLDHLGWPAQYSGIHKRSEFSQRRVHAMPELSTKMDNYLGERGYTTLQDLLEKISEVAPGIPASEILVNYWQLRWTDDATEEELAEKARRQERADQSRAKYERETYERLREKFEGKSA